MVAAQAPSQWPSVLALAAMELTFPAAAHTVLCSAHVSRAALVSHQCCVYCCTILAPHQDSLQAPQSQQAGGGQVMGRGYHQGS